VCDEVTVDRALEMVLRANLAEQFLQGLPTK
jgi:hypothetical protein